MPEDEVEYEYGVQLSDIRGLYAPGRMREEDWMSLGDAQNELEAFQVTGGDGHDLLTYMLVKRRKAGPVEVVDSTPEVL